MNTQQFLMTLGDIVGHREVLEAARVMYNNGETDDYLIRFVEGNEGVGTFNRDPGDEEPGSDEPVDCETTHAGQCGTCRSGVWYPCI